MPFNCASEAAQAVPAQRFLYSAVVIKRWLEGLTIMSNDNNQLVRKSGLEGLAPIQGILDLRVEKEKEVHGISMGVLSDGTPFLTQRGLARLCGVENRHIATIGADWNDSIQKGRITIIKGLLGKRGVNLDMPYTEVVESKRTVHAYSDVASLAILEYFAFESDTLNQDQARNNFRTLAGKALQDFIYTQVGYSPNREIPIAWQQFQDRVLLVYNRVPDGYFSVFKEMADLIVTLVRGGAPVGESFIPDLSVGKHWSAYWVDHSFDRNFGPRRQYDHSYPEYFKQSGSNPQLAYCYPDNALGEFRRWMREIYLKDKFGTYISAKEKRGELPPSFAQLALSAIEVV